MEIQQKIDHYFLLFILASQQLVAIACTIYFFHNQQVLLVIFFIVVSSTILLALAFFCIFLLYRTAEDSFSHINSGTFLFNHFFIGSNILYLVLICFSDSRNTSRTSPRHYHPYQYLYERSYLPFNRPAITGNHRI